MDTNKIKDLLKKHMAGNLSDSERLIFWMELNKPENAIEIKAIFLELSYGTEESSFYNPEEWEEMIPSILTAGKAERSDKVYKLRSSDSVESPVCSIAPKRRKLTWAAAAAILILLATGSYFFFSTMKANQMAIAPVQGMSKNDVAPGSSKAILYLANGQKINLDSAHNGQLASLSGTKVIKTDSGKLLYASANENDLIPAGLNTLSTPRGGIYQITLPDGTQAWLNAGSSITYPTRFVKKQRDVSITGEVYFEVAKDVAHPFIVSLPAKTKDQRESGSWMQVEVLGTHFNINAYNSNENNLARTTLLEGSVKVLAHGASRMIKPGEQASASLGSPRIGVSDKVDVGKVIAWKNGEIALNNSSVEQIMQEISRWYDVDIKYAGRIPNKGFYGSIDRTVPLSSVLKALEAYGVKTKLEGKTIIVE